jgi:hypothetical protein
VAGDVTIDWRFAQLEAHQESTGLWDPDFWVHGYFQDGGAILLRRIVANATTQLAPMLNIVGPAALLPSERIVGGPPFWHTYAVCSSFPDESDLAYPPRRDRDTLRAQTPHVWRAARFLGLERHDAECEGHDLVRLFERAETAPHDAGDADLLLISDHDHGFNKYCDIWPTSLTLPSNNCKWVVAKCTRPNFRSALWNHLTSNVRFEGRLVALFTVRDLRLNGMRITERLSWEAILEDIIREVDANKDWKLSQCEFIVVQSLTDGAVILHMDTKTAEIMTAEIVFDPKHTEDEWLTKREGSGLMAGYSMYFCAAIAARLIALLSAEQQSDQPVTIDAVADAIRNGVKEGLAASRLLWLGGFHVSEETTIDGKHHFPLQTLSLPDDLLASALDSTAEQKSAALTETAGTRDRPSALRRLLLDELDCFQHRAVPCDRIRSTTLTSKIAATKQMPSKWTLFDERYSGQDEVMILAREIIRVGPYSLPWEIPIGTFGRLWSADRDEVEALRSIRSVIFEYIRDPERRIPLSIAVFGPPGSGKSFTITQLFESLPDSSRSARGQSRYLTFNLSQFADSRPLFECLHQVRDASLSGNVPLVFWDEFDANFAGTRLAWLRYFLAPMQDGQFQHENVTHNVGRAIFVFAGGTSYRYQDFKTECERDSVVSTDLSANAKGTTKGVDFISRLKGSVDVSAIDPPPGVFMPTNSMILRRALVLRFALERYAPKMKEADQITVRKPVSKAFLLAERYRYGARSIEAIVQMSSLFDHSTFQESSLPRAELLNLHVEAESFLEILAKAELGENQLVASAP